MPRGRRTILVGAAAAAALLAAACGQGGPVVAAGSPPDTAPEAGPPTRVPDVFTPVVARQASEEHRAVLGTDGRWHVVYELVLTNAKSAPAAILEVDVLDAASPDEPLISYAGAALLDQLVTVEPRPVETAVIEPNGSRFLYVELAFDSPDDVPAEVVHRFDLLAALSPGTTEANPMTYTITPVELSTEPVPVLGPPLAGDGWVAGNGCCFGVITHRGSFQSVNGGLYDAQRFAIDYLRLNEAGELVTGDPSVVENYANYGAEVLAVADATVVAVLEDLDDQVPGVLPDPTTITLETVDGNHVVLDLGDGNYAFYAHLQRDSVPVEPGDKVTRGQVLGLLGNTGNTSAPHLHFHVMDRPSVLGSEGLPYVIDGFDLAGQIDPVAFGDALELGGVWLPPGSRPTASPRTEQFPLNLNVVDFPA